MALKLLTQFGSEISLRVPFNIYVVSNASLISYIYYPKVKNSLVIVIKVLYMP